MKLFLYGRALSVFAAASLTLSCQTTTQVTRALSQNTSSPSLATEDFSDLEAEYAGFTTQALTQTYLQRKIDTFLAENRGPELRREIAFADFKHPDTLVNIMGQEALCNQVVAVQEVIDFRSTDAAFDS